MKQILSTILFLLCCQGLLAQYTLNGFATQDACNAYSLTQAAGNQNGSVWNNNKIDLSQSFDFNFDVYLGDPEININGADGIAFVLQPISTSVGSTGGGLGYNGITPAVGVTIDTWQNGNDNDPAFDHIAIQLNGNLNHNVANNIAGPVTAINGNDNIEDGVWHSFRIQWDAATKTFSAYIDGSLRVSAVNDFVTNVFAGNPLVFWGFTGSTGGANNHQRFRTALNPSFTFAPTQKRCINEPITFISTTVSFTNIAKFYWDFGDNSPIDSVNLNPLHIYIAAGDYIVKQRVIGADGCEATNTQTVRVGSTPVLNFTPLSTYCAGSVIPFSATVTVAVGTIDPTSWFWNLGNGQTSTLQNPTTIYNTSGNKNITVSVKSIEGCLSGISGGIINVNSQAFGDFTFTDSVCLGQPTNFFGTVSSFGGDPVTDWFWHIDNANLYLNDLNPVHFFSTPGNHSITFFSTIGLPLGLCPAITSKIIYVKDKPVAKFGVGVPPLCAGLPIQFSDSSVAATGSITKWSWVNNNIEWSTQQNTSNPFTQGNQTVRLIATNNSGCSDTAYQTFYVNPVPDVTMSFNNSCKNAPVNFSAVDNSGTVTQWKWVFGDGAVATTQNAQHTYTANGTYKVKLFATASNGCYSDSLQKDIIIYGTNAFAGNDTIAAAGQPVQLKATGGLSYTWSPAALLNDPNIANPIAILTATQTFSVKAFTPEGCESYDDVTVKIYNGPDIYLPNAFTPNGDTKNDVFRGIAVGIKQFNYLKVYNRWGQLVFYATDYNKGWDGTWKGQQQPGGVYIVLANGIDFKGNIIDKKSTVMLIR